MIFKALNMRCNNCGTDNDINSRYCKRCGSSLYSNVGVHHTTRKSRMSPLKLILIAVLVIFVALSAVTAYIVYVDTSPSEILYLNNKNPGDVTSNSELAANIPDTALSRQIIDAAKQGVPVYKIGDGKGPVTVISAGVHGDQLVPTVASMKLINYLDGRKINGTVYIIPFTSPSALSKNTKLTDGVNLNTVADKDGTTSNDIIKLAQISNASAVADFHETQAGKNPGRTTIMCSQVPTPGSFQLAQDMSSLSLDTTLTYYVAGVEYEGAIEDVSNINGIPAVTPIVLVSSHGKVYHSAVGESYNQMLALLIANHNLNPNDSYLQLANVDIDGWDSLSR